MIPVECASISRLLTIGKWLLLAKTSGRRDQPDVSM